MNKITFALNSKFIPITVYRNRSYNSIGITKTVDTIYIPCEEGNFQYLQIEPELIFLEEERSPEYWALVPWIKPENTAGPMAGGNLAYSADSRIRRVYHIHDRFETWEEYEHLSR